ncbi:hypothetical protein [Kerstersia gyiorum]|jgi:hypothetical protein|uniref:hypothetical protein n=1 Tax=Kerstersia gyiorum TaxID=206506 RepID=UPI00243204BB|nr:hypothetical protein [Kerstersia gyiorum]MCH4271784.1 hypothetical protein [Kerstersia gyiorum]MCI1227647.1 hypothetical protein [Kerstersia gyiorum]
MAPKGKNQIVVWDGCPELVRVAVAAFEQACTPSYTMASRRYSIWSKVREYLDTPVEQALDAVGQSELLDGLFSRWLEMGRERGERERLGRLRTAHKALLRQHRHDPRLMALLETLYEVGMFVLLRRSRTSVGVKVIKAAEAVNHGRKVSPDYPFCELCWRKTMRAVVEASEEGKRRGNAWKFSGRFCTEHNPSDPTSRYRVDHRYRQRFQDEVKRQWELVKLKEQPWGQVPDETVVRMQAFILARVPERTRADEMRGMAQQGASKREIAVRFGVSRQAVHKVLVKNI